ncbi:thioesterase [Pseudonocardiaceae bacterium YIM PH 21723]|nr:thioesterase [Pseudonocardiaceae bacterium YIM PH 21723]
MPGRYRAAVDRHHAPVQPAIVTRRRISSALWQFGDAPATTVLAPFGGGSAYSVADWLPHVADSAIIVQYPGRGPRAGEAHATSLGELAHEVAIELATHTTGPLTLVGHSVGALLCHEITRELEDRGRRVAQLVVSAARPAHLSLLREEQVLAMDRAAWLSALVGNGFGTPELMANQLAVDMALDALRADYLLLARHLRAGGAVRAPLLAIGSSDDPWLDEDHLTAWGELTTGPFATAVMPGDHFYYRNDPVAFGKAVRAGCAARPGPTDVPPAVRRTPPPHTAPGDLEFAATKLETT